jgi:hypothetical protein
MKKKIIKKIIKKFHFFYRVYKKIKIIKIIKNMEKVLETFEINNEKYKECLKENSNFVRSYFSQIMDYETRKHFMYLDGLNSNCKAYLQFGGDKCGIKDFKKFCKKINVDINENLIYIIHELKNIKEEIKNGTYVKENDPYDIISRYHFYSKDKKITFTCSCITDNYLGYFGVTGEASKVLKVFQIFSEMGTWDELCWGRRDFI